MAIIRCTCCQAEITAPQFFNGFAYGYTCIKKVSGQKQVKRNMVKADSFYISGQGRVSIVAMIDGNKVHDVGYQDLRTGLIRCEKLIVTADNQCFVYVK